MMVLKRSMMHEFQQQFELAGNCGKPSKGKGAG
jgi:hypothetical protein